MKRDGINPRNFRERDPGHDLNAKWRTPILRMPKNLPLWKGIQNAAERNTDGQQITEFCLDRDARDMCVQG